MKAGGPRGGLAGLLLGLVLLAPVTAATLTGRVVRILDGDTVEVLNATQHTERVRLGGIDAPEKSQAFGTQAKQRLADLAGGQTVSVDWRKRDRNGRVVGTLLRDDRDLGLQMVREGYAWWYRAFANEQSAVDRVLYEAAEQSARTARRGLWADARPMAPWDYRHQPAPTAHDLGQCPCGGDQRCTGSRGGRFCITPSGAKRYADHATP